MKTLSLIVALSLLTPSLGFCTAIRYQGESPRQESSSKSNVVPITLIVTGAVTLTYIIFKCNKKNKKTQKKALTNDVLEGIL